VPSTSSLHTPLPPSSLATPLNTCACRTVARFMFLSCFPIKSRIFIAFSWKSSTYFYPSSISQTKPLHSTLCHSRDMYVRITRACCQRIWAMSSCGFCFGFLLVSCWFCSQTTPVFSPPFLSISGLSKVVLGLLWSAVTMQKNEPHFSLTSY